MSDNTKLSIREMLDALESDKNFQILKKMYNSPNGFTIMGNKRREEWHSNFVKWLLDPKENHKLGKIPLENFLKLVESKQASLKINKSDIADMHFETEHRTKSGRFIDIFGISNSLVLVIENKIKATENYKGDMPQSDDYYMYCEENYKDRQRCYVLLKAFSNSSLKNKEYIHITYQELFDQVINPACKISQKLKLEDTKRILDQYAIDISTPFSNSSILAYTQKDISKEIYEKHEKIIEIMRNSIRENHSDRESDICKFFYENIKYINNIILKSLGKSIIQPKSSEFKQLKGRELIKELLQYNYIIPNQTELIYKYMSATCIIKIDENEKFYTGFYEGDYDGSQKVEALESEFEKLRDAELEVEKALGSQNSNGGKSAYELILLNSGVEEAEGKKIGDFLEQL